MPNPDDIDRDLRARAAVAGVSPFELALSERERVTRRPRVSEVLARARARKGGASVAAIVEAVRSGRDGA
jgi:hypothetical protein